MENFSPLSSLAGGVLIGAAAWLLLAFNGRVAGVSTIMSGILRFDRGDLSWRVLFALGLVVGTLAYRAGGGPLAAIQIETSLPVLLAGGLLAGFGTYMGGGCTSGHGVCGLARLSVRSLVAVAVFMVTAGATVYVVRHAMGGV